MLQTIKPFYGIKLGATDGDIGHVKDFYFDDKTWAIRYIVVDTGSWLPGRQVLLTPHAFPKHPLEDDASVSAVLHVNLTRKQIEDSPPIDSHRPVSRQYEADYYAYYGWPNYWDGMGGLVSVPIALPPPPVESPGHRGHNQRDDIHLRSTKSISGYTLQATDGPIGSVSNFIVETENWKISEWVVEAGHWYAGKTITVGSDIISRISYEDSTVFVNQTKLQIEQSANKYLAHAGATHH